MSGRKGTAERLFANGLPRALDQGLAPYGVSAATAESVPGAPPKVATWIVSNARAICLLIQTEALVEDVNPRTSIVCGSRREAARGRLVTGFGGNPAWRGRFCVVGVAPSGAPTATLMTESGKAIRAEVRSRVYAALAVQPKRVEFRTDGRRLKVPL